MFIGSYMWYKATGSYKHTNDSDVRAMARMSLLYCNYKYNWIRWSFLFIVFI